MDDTLESLARELAEERMSADEQSAYEGGCHGPASDWDVANYMNEATEFVVRCAKTRPVKKTASPELVAYREKRAAKKRQREWDGISASQRAASWQHDSGVAWFLAGRGLRTARDYQEQSAEWYRRARELFLKFFTPHPAEDFQ